MSDISDFLSFLSSPVADPKQHASPIGPASLLPLLALLAF